MKGDPFALIEGLTIAGFAVGAEKGYIYIRGEYPGRSKFSRTQSGCARKHVSRQEYSGQRFFLTSNRAAAPALTSAARKPRSSIRSKAFAVSPATSLLSQQSGLFRQPPS